MSNQYELCRFRYAPSFKPPETAEEAGRMVTYFKQIIKTIEAQQQRLDILKDRENDFEAFNQLNEMYECAVYEAAALDRYINRPEILKKWPYVRP